MNKDFSTGPLIGYSVWAEVNTYFGQTYELNLLFWRPRKKQKTARILQLLKRASPPTLVRTPLPTLLSKGMMLSPVQLDDVVYGTVFDMYRAGSTVLQLLQSRSWAAKKTVLRLNIEAFVERENIK